MLKSDSGNISEEVMRDAVNKVTVDGMKVEVARQFSIHKVTLDRYMNKHRLDGTRLTPNYNNRQIFTNVEERQLTEYLLMSS